MPCVNITGWWWWCCVMVWGVFSWHILGPSIKVEQRLNSTGYLNIIANQVHPFMAAVYASVNGFLQQDNAPCYKDRIVQEWFHEHDSEFSFLQWPAKSPDLNPIEHLWDEMEWAIRSRDPLPGTWHNCGVNMGQHPCGTLLTPCRVHAPMNWGCSKGKRRCNSILGMCSSCFVHRVCVCI